MISAAGKLINSSPFWRSSSESFSKSASAVASRDRNLEAVLTVFRLHEVDHRSNLVAAHHEQHRRRVAILRDEGVVIRP